jgi:hypothetical protein
MSGLSGKDSVKAPLLCRFSGDEKRRSALAVAEGDR